MPIPIDARRKPASVKIHVSSGAGVDIVWADGHASHYGFAYLREECPCAMCNDERQKKRESKFPSASPAGPSILPMYKPKLAAKAAHAVGNYALQIDFNDGHTAGIFSFDFLRTICPCEECAREYRTSAQSSV
jgi:prepilin-type processing-associated H-X9-DG protein